MTKQAACSTGFCVSAGILDLALLILRVSLPVVPQLSLPNPCTLAGVSFPGVTSAVAVPTG